MFFYCRNQIEAFAAAAMNGKFAIYEYDQSLILDLVHRGYFNNLTYETDYVLISDYPQNIGKVLRNQGILIGPTHPFSFLGEFDYQSILIHDQVDPLGKFEKTAALGKIDLNHIYILPEAWQNRTRRQDDILEKAYANAECTNTKVSGGGLSSKELCAHIIDCMEHIKNRNIKGDIVNLGVYRGWSLHFLAEVRDRLGLNQKIYGFDTFDGFPNNQNSPYDSFVEYMVGARIRSRGQIHKDTSYDFVSDILKKFEDIVLIKGDIGETVKMIDELDVCLALFDMDNYTPTKASLAQTYSALNPGGFIIHDHYSYPSCQNPGLYGQRQAMVEFLQQHKMFNLSGTNIFMKY